MRQITPGGCFSRIASSAAVFFAFHFALERPLHAQTIPFVETFDDGVVNNNYLPNTYWQTGNWLPFSSISPSPFCNGLWLTSLSLAGGLANTPEFSSGGECPFLSLGNFIINDQSGVPGHHFLFFGTGNLNIGNDITAESSFPNGIFYMSPPITVPAGTTNLTLSWYIALEDSINPPVITPYILTGTTCANAMEYTPTSAPPGCVIVTNAAMPYSYTTATANPDWVQSSFSFNTGGNTPIFIALVDGNNNAMPPPNAITFGNDFGLDTISLDAGYIEVCKASSTTNPVSSTGLFPFTVTNSAFSSSSSPLMVPLGECSGPIEVAPGIATIQELPTPGVAVSAITVGGYSQSGAPLLVSQNTQTGTAMVVVQPSLGRTSEETIVTFTNSQALPAELKICKVAGSSNVAGLTFPFTVVNITNAGSGYLSAPTVTFTGTGCTTPPTAFATVSGGSVTGITLISPGSCTSSPVVGLADATHPIGGPNTATATAAIVSVTAGPPAEGGYCMFAGSAVEVGTSGAVMEEVPPGGYSVPIVTVNGIPTQPSPCVTSNGAFPCGVVALIGPGINEVDFSNCRNVLGPGCAGSLTITTTSLASGQVGAPYSQTLTAVGGRAPYTWSLISGALPSGLTLGATNGVISGTPSEAVTATPLKFQIADSSLPPQTTSVSLTLITTQQTTPPTITTTALNGGLVGTAYSQMLTATGGTVPYTWQLTSGTLPPGLTLNASTGAISGVPTAGATAVPLTFKVTDSSTPAQSAVATFTLTITATQTAGPLTITTTALNGVVVGTPFSQTLAATGGIEPYMWRLIMGRLPSGLTLNPSTGQISGIAPAEVAGGVVTFQVTDASNPSQTATASFALNITPTVTGLTILKTPLNNGVVNGAYSQTLAATRGTVPYTWQLTSGTLPPGLTLNSSTGAISGIPTAGATATPLTFKVTDSGTPAQSALATFTLTIAATTTTGPLTITTFSLPDGGLGGTYSQTLSAIGGTGPYMWKVIAGRLPLGLFLNPLTGEITGFPEATADGVLTFQVMDASNPPQTAIRSLSLTIVF